MESSSKEGTESFTCPLCGLVKHNLEQMVQHMDGHNTEVDIAMSANERGATSLLECPMCSFTCISSQALELHVNGMHLDQEDPISFSCPFCTSAFDNSILLQKHIHNDHRESDGYICPVCEQGGFHTNEELGLHVDQHFEIEKQQSDTWLQEIERREREKQHWKEQRNFEDLRAQYGMKDNGGFSKQRIADMQKAVLHGEMSVADYHERKILTRAKEQQGVDDQHFCTKDIIPIIREWLSRSPITLRVYLCSDVDHYQSTYGDKGWGCGYRNLQMLISSLSKHRMYAERLKATFGESLAMPSIPRLQQQIETAWSQGFDLQGSKQLGSKLHNTSKWIGATEVVAVLSSLRIKCQLVDFHRPTAVNGCHPELFNWVLEFFKKHRDFIPPLYLQHEGHSRTIVGIEELRQNKLQLLIFDPSHSLSQLKYPSSIAKSLHLIRKPCPAMKHKQYQIVAVTGVMANDDEYQRSKVLQSRRIP